MSSLFVKLIRLLINLVPIFSIGYTIYVFYYFLTMTGGNFPGKIPESDGDLLRSYVELPLMSVCKSDKD